MEESPRASRSVAVLVGSLRGESYGWSSVPVEVNSSIVGSADAAEGMSAFLAGKRADIHHRAIEVLRRQPDGRWKLIVGDPNARG